MEVQTGQGNNYVTFEPTLILDPNRAYEFKVLCLRLCQQVPTRYFATVVPTGGICNFYKNRYLTGKINCVFNFVALLARTRTRGRPANKNVKLGKGVEGTITYDDGKKDYNLVGTMEKNGLTTSINNSSWISHLIFDHLKPEVPAPCNIT